ncbi:Anaphase-promoting complex subunit 4 [Borealophlyctis nickersoniae]|nr:Anaphase-promoting complex subunit 4 [Borealophlyctis nickersoniae]
MSMIAESMDPSSNLSGFWLTALDPVLLFSRKSELRLLAWRSTHVDFLLHYLGDGLRALKSDHNTLVAYDRDLEETFRAAAENHNVPPNAEANFIAMLGSGKPSTGLEQFMMQTLRRSGIDKWQQVVINTYASMSRLIFVYVMPALEQLIMHLGDLIGLTRWYEHLGVAGLNERDVELVVCLAESLVDDLQKLSSAVDRDSKHFQKFIVWLRAAYDFVAGESSAGDVDQLSTVDTVDVSSYIRESLFKDPLSAYFAGEAAIGGLAGVGIDRFGENGVEPLESRMQDLTERCKRIFDAPARAIGTSIQLTGCVRMTDFPAKPDNHGDAETALRSVIPSLYHCQEKSSVAHYAIFYLDAAFDIDNSASLWVLRHRKSAAGRRGFVVAQTENPAAIKWEGEIARFPVLPMLGELQDPELVDVDFLSVQSLIWLIRSRDVDSGTEESNLFTSRIDNLLFLPISTHGVVQKSIQSEIIRQQGEPFVPEAHFAGRLEKSNASFMEVNLTTANVMLGILEGNGSRLRLLEETPDEDDEDEVVDDGDEEEEEA